MSDLDLLNKQSAIIDRMCDACEKVELAYFNSILPNLETLLTLNPDTEVQRVLLCVALQWAWNQEITPKLTDLDFELFERVCQKCEEIAASC